MLKLISQAFNFAHSNVLLEWIHYHSEYDRVNQTDLCITVDNCAGL